MSIESLAIEKSVLSSFLFNNTEFYEYGHLLQPDDFFLPSFQNIFETMAYLYEKELPIEETFILKYCDSNKVKQEDLITILATNAITNISSYIDLIKEESTKSCLNYP